MTCPIVSKPEGLYRPRRIVVATPRSSGHDRRVVAKALGISVAEARRREVAAGVSAWALFGLGSKKGRTMAKKKAKKAKKRKAAKKKPAARCGTCKHSRLLHTRSGCAHMKPGGGFCNCPRAS